MSERKKVTLPVLFEKVANGEPLTWLTCYDYPTAYLQEQAGLDMILVGDSLGMTMLGYDSTLPVTMDDMIRHTAAVRRGAPTAVLIGDMPYMSYQPSVETAIRNAGRFMAETGCDAIKLEGGAEMVDRIAACFGHKTAGIANGRLHAGLVAHVRHVANHESRRRAAAHGRRMADHIVHGHRQRAIVTQHGHAQAVANEDHIQACLLLQIGRRIVVTGQPGDRLPVGHFLK